MSVSQMTPITIKNRAAEQADNVMNSFPVGFYRHYRNQIPDKNVDPDGYAAGMGIKGLTMSC